MRHRSDVPDVVQDRSCLTDQQSRKLTVVSPGAGHGRLVDCPRALVEKERYRRNIGLSALHAHIALALLFGVVERVGVQKRADKLTTHIFEAEFEMRVLVARMVAAIKSGRANIQPLLVRDFVGVDQARRVTGARRRNGGIERMRERIAQGHTRRSRFHPVRSGNAVKHAGLRGHVENRFYTEWVEWTKGGKKKRTGFRRSAEKQICV